MMHLLNQLTTLASRAAEAEALQRKRPTFIPGAARRLWRNVRKSGLKREKPLPAVLTRQNVRAALRTELYRRAKRDYPAMSRRDRRNLARALAAKRFKESRELPKAA